MTDATTLRRPIVLCVDDEPHVLHALERALRREGWEVHTATNGPDALTMLRHMRVHVLICDEAMPGMRGLQVLREARMLSPQTIRIMLTGHCADPKVVVPAVNEGEVFRLLPKPWDDAELCRLVAEGLGAAPAEWARAQAQAQSRLRGSGPAAGVADTRAKPGAERHED